VFGDYTSAGLGMTRKGIRVESGKLVENFDLIKMDEYILNTDRMRRMATSLCV
jgi:hypothetical protein